MRKPLALTSAALLGLVIIVASCSDKSTPSNVNKGNVNDPAFTLAKEDADSLMTDVQVSNDEAGNWLVWAPPFGFGKVAGDSVSYDTTTGWHVSTRSFTNQILQFAVVDSFRFTALDGSFQFRSDSLTNIFERRLKKTFTKTVDSGDPATAWQRTFDINTRWVGLADTITSLNGDFHRHWQGEDEHRSFTRDIQGQLQNIQFVTEELKEHPRTGDVHPFSGTLVAQVDVDKVLPNRQVHIQGTLTVTFFPDHLHAVFVSGSNTWEWDIPYGPDDNP